MLEKRKRNEQKQKNAAWSKEMNRKVVKEKRKDKKVKKRERMKATEDAAAAGSEVGEDEEDDWDELAKEERMAKKVKKGTLDSNAFHAEFVGL